VTERAALPMGMTPRLLSREEAAAYVGLSPNSFDIEVRAGTFAGPVRLKRVDRRLWDRKALDLALDAKLPAVADLGADGFESRRQRWNRREDHAEAAG
jgi:hypothetical protein